MRLARTNGVGPATFVGLIERFATAARAIAEVPRLAQRGGAADIPRIPSEEFVLRELESLERFGGTILCSCEPDYPAGLRALDAPPPVLSVAGQRDLLARDMVAVVGARNASALGRKFAARLAQELGQAGFVVTSGLARGIDAAAHEGSLASGTCAVVAGGIDVIYPPEHAGLFARIAAEGVVVAEMPFGQAPQARHFPRRNRIISGLSRCVVVVEAAEGSGSLITANYALEQGRDVFAVPGSPLDPRAKGTNRLLREGAILTESADDVIAVLREQHFSVREPSREPDPLPLFDESSIDKLRGELEELLGAAPVEIDDLVRQTGASVRQVVAVLLELELAGRVERQSGGKITRIHFQVE